MSKQPAKDALAELKERYAQILESNQAELEQIRGTVAEYAQAQEAAEAEMDTYMATADREKYLDAKKRAAEAADSIEWANKRLQILSGGALMEQAEFTSLVTGASDQLEEICSKAEQEASELIRKALETLRAAEQKSTETNAAISNLAIDIMRVDSANSYRSGAAEAHRIPSMITHARRCVES